MRKHKPNEGWMKAFCWASWKQGDEWGMWFRVFGYGLVFSTMRPIFSERNGYTKYIRVFGVKIGLLRP